MKSQIIYFVAFLLVVVFVASCEKTVEFKSDEIEPKIVVNAVFYAGNRHKHVKVEKSRSILNDKGYFEALPDANVRLYEDGKFITEMNYISRIDTFYDRLNYGVVEKYPFEYGVYSDTSLVVKPGSTYRLEVTHDGFDPVHCETNVPVPVELGEMSIAMEKIPKQHFENYFRIKLKLSVYDTENEVNYYRMRVGREQGYEAALKMFGGYYYNGPGSVYYGGGGYYGGGYGRSPSIDIDSVVPSDTIIQEVSYNMMVYSYDPVFSPDGNTDVLTTESGTIDFFTNELINSGKYDLSFRLETWRDVYTEIGEYLKIHAHVMSLSPELYFYSISRQQQSLAMDNPFAEPVPVYSNVVGGIGIFGSAGTTIRWATIGNYPLEEKTYIEKDEYFKQDYNY